MSVLVEDCFSLIAVEIDSSHCEEDGAKSTSYGLGVVGGWGRQLPC